MKAQSLLCNLTATVIAAFALSVTSCQEQIELQQIKVTQVKADDLTTKCTVEISNTGSHPILECGVMYDSKDWNDQKAIKASNFSGGKFEVSIPQLLPGSIYGVRGYYRTEKGVVYSDVYEFTTKLLEGTVTDADNNTYTTVKIGNYEWMTQNLRATKFADQTAITHTDRGQDWVRAGVTPRYCLYDNTTDTHGYLYNGYTRNKTIIEGWRVPTREEWKALQNHLISHRYGNDMIEDNFIAKSMASTTLWEPSTVPGTIGFEPETNNSSKFNATPGGYREGERTAPFKGVGAGAYFWSSTSEGDNFYFATLKNNELGFDLENKVFNAGKPGTAIAKYGFSIRLVRDLTFNTPAE